MTGSFPERRYHLSRKPLYSIHGLVVESEIPLDARRVGRDNGEWHDDDPSGSRGAHAPDYRIVEGEPRDIPHQAPPGRILGGFPEAGYWVTEGPSGSSLRTLRYTGMCEAILDRRRRTIEIRRARRCDSGLLPLFVQGGVLAHALMAEGRLTLHASAVERGGRALALVGPFGTGKSTLTALLCAAGARLVSDDTLRIDPSSGGAVCFPGTNRIRLAHNAKALGGEVHGADLRTTVDGRTSVLPPRVVESSVELASVLFPSPSSEARELEIELLHGSDGLVELLRCPRLAGWRATEPVVRLFELSAGVADSVAAFRATVPWGPPFQPGLAMRLLSAVGLGGTEDAKDASG